MRSILFLAGLGLLQACTITRPPPPVVSPVIVSAGARTGASADELNAGRVLFVRRCADCHMLPQIATHDANEWPILVNKMAGRAHLDSHEREAVVAYLVAARATL